jgi:phosphatidylglycerol:prolipoprotein diacylglycerol transferase
MNKVDKNEKHKYIATALYLFVFVFCIPLIHFTFGLVLDSKLANPMPMIRPFWLLPILGAWLGALGSFISILAIYSIVKVGNGYPVSSLPPKCLVTAGVYRISRNPIYLGYMVLFLGVSLILRSFWNCVLSWPLFVLFFISYTKNVEEPVLAERYSHQYEAYTRNTARFIALVPARISDEISRRLSAPFSRFLSKCVNNPLILRFHNSIFFVSYGVICALGAGIALVFSDLVLLSLGYSGRSLDVFLLLNVVLIVVCAHLFWLVGTMVIERKPLKAVIGRVGFVSWGGIFGAFVAGPLIAVLARMAYPHVLDSQSLCLIILYSFGRIGCMLYGCCYGKETTSPFHISYISTFTKAAREGLVKSSSLYPVQLFSSLYGFFISTFVIVSWLLKPLPTYMPIASVLILFGLFRFSEEWFRYQKRLIWGMLSVSQIAAVIAACLGGFFFFLALKSGGSTYYPALVRSAIGGRLALVPYPATALATAALFFVFGYHRYNIGRYRK